MSLTTIHPVTGEAGVANGNSLWSTRMSPTAREPGDVGVNPARIAVQQGVDAPCARWVHRVGAGTQPEVAALTSLLVQEMFHVASPYRPTGYLDRALRAI